MSNRTNPILAACACALMIGCDALQRPALDRDFFVLSSAAPQASTNADAPVLRVNRARIAPPFGSRSFQYRTTATEFRSGYYEQWADDPGSLISRSVATALDASGVVRTVDDASPVRGHNLDLYVPELYLEVSSDGSTKAVVALRATLINERGEEEFVREMRRERTTQDSQPASCVDAWSESLASMVEELVVELADAFAAEDRVTG